MTVGAEVPGELVRLVTEPADVVVAAGEHRPADRHRRQRRPRRPRARGAPDQPVGHLGVDRAGGVRGGAARRVDGRGGLRHRAAAVAGARTVVGADPDRLRGPAALHPGRDGDGPMSVAATVAGTPVEVSEVDAREAVLRDAPQVAALPRPGTSEGRQLRRWLTQLVVTERVVAREAEALGVTVTAATPTEDDLLPDADRATRDRQHRGGRAGRPAGPGVVRARHPGRRRRRRRRRRLPRPQPAPLRPVATGGWRIAQRAGSAEVRRADQVAICSVPPGGGPSAGGSTNAAPRWCGWPPATNTPATRASPTTPTNTDDAEPRSSLRPRHRRHQDRRRPRRPRRPAAVRDPAAHPAQRRPRKGLGRSRTHDRRGAGRGRRTRSPASGSPRRAPSTCPTEPSARSTSRPGAASRSATGSPQWSTGCRCAWPATGCAWRSASTGAAPGRARRSCSAWWCPPASAADWSSTARRTAGAPATPGTSGT